MKVAVIGERCSGTKWVETLLERNFQVEADYPFGWKHCPDFSVTATECVTVCVIRNPIDWMRSVFRTPHHIPHDRTRTLFRLLTASPFVSYDGTGQEKWDRDRNGQRWQHLLHMRHGKYAEWVAHGDYWVNYEVVKSDVRGWLSQVAEQWGLRPCVDRWDVVNQRFRGNRVTNSTFTRPLWGKEPAAAARQLGFENWDRRIVHWCLNELHFEDEASWSTALNPDYGGWAEAVLRKAI